MANHSGEFINDKMSRPGNLKHNLVHEDMVYAALFEGVGAIEKHHEARYKAMLKDVSWQQSAKTYSLLYDELVD